MTHPASANCFLKAGAVSEVTLVKGMTYEAGRTFLLSRTAQGFVFAPRFNRHAAKSDRPGDCRVSIVSFRESDGWEMKVLARRDLSGHTRWREARGSTSLWRSLMCS